MIDKTEQEIIKKWDIRQDNPKVSILCITYNQELYIEDTINSFLNQETAFPFEIVIGEDCSTDSTLAIISRYKEKYPNIIRLITSTNNVGMMKNFLRTAKACKGDFIAICEGDDIWTAKDKLQLQYDAMIKNSSIDICFTQAEALDLSTNTKHSYFDFGDKEKIFTLSESVRGGGGFAPTCTFFIRRNIIDNLPDWFEKYAPVGDYYLQMLGSLKGGILYLPQKTGMYRINVGGSWTKDRKKMSRDKIRKEAESHNICLDEFSKLCGDIRDINFSKSVWYYNAVLESINNGYKEDIKEYIEKSWNYYQNMKSKQKKIYKLRNFPKLLYFYYRLKNIMAR